MISRTRRRVVSNSSADSFSSLVKKHFFVEPAPTTSASTTAADTVPTTAVDDKSTESIATTSSEATTTASTEATAQSSTTTDERVLQSVASLCEPMRRAASTHVDGATLLALIDAFAAFVAPNLCVSPAAWYESTREHAALLRLALQYVDPALSNFLRDCGVALETFAHTWVRFIVCRRCCQLRT